MATTALVAPLNAENAALVAGFAGIPFSDALLDEMLEQWASAEARLESGDVEATCWLLKRSHRVRSVDTACLAVEVTCRGVSDPVARPSAWLQLNEFPYTRSGLRNAISCAQRAMSRFKHNGLCGPCWGDLTQASRARHAIAKTGKCYGCIFRDAVQ